MTDRLKHRVYAAESWITGDQCWASAKDAAAFIRFMERDIRFKERYPNHKPVRVFKLKERGAPSAYYSGATHGIYLPYWAQRMKTLCHELAHSVTPDQHGPEFCRAYHWLVATFMSARMADQLAYGFRENGIKSLDYDSSGRRVPVQA